MVTVVEMTVVEVGEAGVVGLEVVDAGAGVVVVDGAVVVMVGVVLAGAGAGLAGVVVVVAVVAVVAVVVVVVVVVVVAVLDGGAVAAGVEASGCAEFTGAVTPPAEVITVGVGWPSTALATASAGPTPRADTIAAADASALAPSRGERARGSGSKASGGTPAGAGSSTVSPFASKRANLARRSSRRAGGRSKAANQRSGGREPALPPPSCRSTTLTAAMWNVRCSPRRTISRTCLGGRPPSSSALSVSWTVAPASIA